MVRILGQQIAALALGKMWTFIDLFLREQHPECLPLWNQDKHYKYEDAMSGGVLAGIVLVGVAIGLAVGLGADLVTGLAEGVRHVIIEKLVQARLKP